MGSLQCGRLLRSLLEHSQDTRNHNIQHSKHISSTKASLKASSTTTIESIITSRSACLPPPSSMPPSKKRKPPAPEAAAACPGRAAVAAEARSRASQAYTSYGNSSAAGTGTRRCVLRGRHCGSSSMIQHDTA